MLAKLVAIFFCRHVRLLDKPAFSNVYTASAQTVALVESRLFVTVNHNDTTDTT